MYSPEAIDTMAAVKTIFDPGNVFNPGVLVDPAPLDADLRVPQARPLRTGLGFAYPHDGGDLSVAVHRCVGVGKCRADTTVKGLGRRVGRHVPVVPGHPGREGLHPRPIARAAGTRERHAGQGLPLGGGGRVARLVLVVQGLLVGLPGRGGHGDLQGRGAVPAVPAPAASAGPLLAGLAAPLGSAGLARAGTGERRAAQPGAGRPGQAAGRNRRPPPAAAVRRAELPRVVRPPSRPGRGSGAAMGGHVHRLLHPRGRPGRRAGARGGRLRGGNHQPAGMLRPDLDLHRPAGRRAQAAAAQPGRP